MFLSQGMTSSKFYGRSSDLQMGENGMRKTPFEHCCSYVTDIVSADWTNKVMEMRMKNKVGFGQSLLMNLKQKRES